MHSLINLWHDTGLYLSYRAGPGHYDAGWLRYVIPGH